MKLVINTPSCLVNDDELYDVTGMGLYYKNYCVIRKDNSIVNPSVICKKVVNYISDQEEHICDEFELYNFIKDNINEYIFLVGFSITEVLKISEFVIAEKNKHKIIDTLDGTKNNNIKKPSTRTKKRNK